MPFLSMRKTMSQTTIEGLYPILIIGAGALIRLLKKRASQQKKEREALPPSPPPASPIRVVAAPTPSRKSPQPVFLPPLVQKKIKPPTTFRRRRPRIAKLIAGVKQKQSLVLLSEILVNKHHIK